MRKKTGWAAGLILLGTVLLSGCRMETSQDLISPDETYDTSGNSPSDYTVEDKESLYEDQDNEVITMYLTIGMGNEEDGTNHT